MSDKYTHSTQHTSNGVGIDKWMEKNVYHILNLTQGPKIMCKMIDGKQELHALNSVGILFKECRFLREGTSSNHGSGGSNCATGTPVCFVHIPTVFPKVFSNSTDGILSECKGPCFILPLVQLDKAHDLLNLMNECYAEFVAQRHGNTAHDITHIVNGICSGSAAILFALCQEITLNGTKPNIERQKFLVEALYLLLQTAHSVAKYSKQCDKIFRLMPYVANSADTFQSVLMAFCFDEIPSKPIRVKHVGSSIFRHFKYEGWNAKYAEKTPAGLIGLLLIAPMICGLLTSEIETSVLINSVVRSINDAILAITTSFATLPFRELADDASNFPKRFKLSETRSELFERIDSKIRIIHLQNKHILHEFAKKTTIQLVTPDEVNLIYNAVIEGNSNIASAIGIVEHPDYIVHSSGFTLNGSMCTNFPVLIKDDSYIPASVNEWTALSIKLGAIYEFSAVPMGLSTFKSGKTVGEQFIANFRFTAGDRRSREIMRGLYPGYAATGMYYYPETKSFKEAESHSMIDPNGKFIIKADYDMIVFSQDDIDVLRIPVRRDIDTLPMICFKYTTISIKLIELIPKDKPDIKEPTPVSSGISFADIAKEVKSSEIDPCLSLTDALKTLKVCESPRKQSKPYGQWGEKTANKLEKK